MNDIFAGIYEKLERADKNILNLQSEIDRFFQGCKYPVLPKMSDERHLEAIEYHKSLAIPLRFSVLAGEIVHHYRSCFDHIVWQLSDPTYRTANERFIEFPILLKRPALKDKFTKYKRKIAGIKNRRALRLIALLQPYRAPDPPNFFLWIIHDMDRIDKHRDIALVHNQGLAKFKSPQLASIFARYVNGTLSGPLPASFKREFDEQGEIAPEIAFSNVGGGIKISVVPLLNELSRFTRQMVGLFDECRY